VNPWTAAYRGRRVLLTGHTGFKGGWLALWLARLGADVTGYSLPAPADRPTLFSTSDIRDCVRHVEADVRDASRLRAVWEETRPDIVFHLAAQPIVRESYRSPLDTVMTNVLGTVNVLETARVLDEQVALVVVTSDKSYENVEQEQGYAEHDRLGGADVYSGSKAAAEVLISSYRRSFFEAQGIAAASARAGNVIGGGDWSPDRIVPDAIRALMKGQAIEVRNPVAVRPWQHVLEPLSGYLHLGAELLSGRRRDVRDGWNFGPTVRNSRTVRELVELIVNRWGSGGWRDASMPGAPHEATLLRLDIRKAQTELGWGPRWSFEQAVAYTVDWYKASRQLPSMADYCRAQIDQYETGCPDLSS
jgi:CDP-glucose 4,6-dehydratase